MFLTYDPVLHTLAINATFSGLLGLTSASHIHCCTALPNAGTAGVATTTPSFVGFPLNVTSGTFINTLDLTQAGSYNPAFVTAQGSIALAEAALANSFIAGTSYFNIHTSVVGGGEIRGFIAPIPEPATMSLLGLGLGGLIAARRKRRA